MSSSWAPEGRPPRMPEPPVPTSFREPNLPHPSCRGGELRLCEEFIHLCLLIFDQQPSTYVNDSSKVETFDGSSCILGTSSEQCTTRATVFLPQTELHWVFHHPVWGRDTGGRFLDRIQGRQSVADTSMDFRILAVDSGFKDGARHIL